MVCCILLTVKKWWNAINDSGKGSNEGPSSWSSLCGVIVMWESFASLRRRCFCCWWWVMSVENVFQKLFEDFETSYIHDWCEGDCRLGFSITTVVPTMMVVVSRSPTSTLRENPSVPPCNPSTSTLCCLAPFVRRPLDHSESFNQYTHDRSMAAHTFLLISERISTLQEQEWLWNIPLGNSYNFRVTIPSHNSESQFWVTIELLGFNTS